MQRSILLIGGGLLQCPAVEIAKLLGLKVFVSDRDENCACASVADKFFKIDTRDCYGNSKLAEFLKAKENLVAVFTQGASVELTVASAAAYVSLPGLPIDAAMNISHKGRMRSVLMSANIPQPKFEYYQVNEFQLAKSQWQKVTKDNKAYEKLEMPIVIKAVDSSASRGQTILEAGQELTQEIFDLASSFSTTGEVLIEEKMLADPSETIWEQSVETLWYNGKGYWLNWVDRPFLEIDKYAIESEVLCPAMHKLSIQHQVEKMVLQAGKALGMTTGIFKADIFLSKDGPRILETTARLSGGFDAQYLTPLAFGTSYICGAMKMALGESPPWEYFLPCRHYHSIAKWVFLPRGIVKSLDFSKAEQFGFVLSRVKVGDQVGDYRNCADRSIVCIAAGTTRFDADRRAETMKRALRVKVE